MGLLIIKKTISACDDEIFLQLLLAGIITSSVQPKNPYRH